MIPLLVACLAACGSNVQPSSLIEETPRRLWLMTSCTQESVSARVTETAAEVRIDDVRAERYDRGDCQGAATIDLDAPIGDRIVTVDGDTWIRIDDDCDHAEYARADVEEAWGWHIPIPCEHLDRSP